MHKGAIDRLLRTDKPLNDEASASTLPADEDTGRATAHACSIAIAAPETLQNRLPTLVKPWAVATPLLGCSAFALLSRKLIFDALKLLRGSVAFR